MKCKDCACYKNNWCTMVTDSPDPDMERDCGHFIRANKWIPMREQNPEKHGTYLVWDGKEMNTAKWFCVDVPSHGIKDGWSESMPEGGTYPPFPWRVTHWMPLPEPPERLHYLPPSPERAKLRSKTFPGIAAAMAEQWGRLL